MRKKLQPAYLKEAYNKKAMGTLAILGYHKIGDPPSDGWHTWNYVPEHIFEEQLQYLKENNWNVIDEVQFLRGLEQPDLFSSKSVLITFDDGYKNNLTVALPVLKRFSYPAIVFVPTAFVGSYNAFDADIFYEPKEEICTWDELKELEKCGLSIEAHSVNHPHFSDINYDQLTAEITNSKQILEQKLGKEIQLFSFPYGDNGTDADGPDKILSASGYKAAFMFAGSSINGIIENRFRIPRIALGPDTDMSQILNS